MSELLIILSTHRSFSSVVSTMIGEHPDLYGFPELHLFMGDTVEEIIDIEVKKAKHYGGPPGVLRTLAQLHDGIQTTASIIKAVGWLSERRYWSTKTLFDYILERIQPKIGVEKSPPMTGKRANIERAYAFYPNAYFLHLTRHPVSARKSMEEFRESLKNTLTTKDSQPEIPWKDDLLVWYQMHSNILEFTNTLPTGQTLRLKGESILSEPDVYLPQIAEWLGIRTDPAAIEAMKHPENSPYAYRGPLPACGGNDSKFSRSPHLRGGRVREPSLQEFLERESLSWFSEEYRQSIEQNELSFVSEQEIALEVTRLAHLMGYH